MTGLWFILDLIVVAIVAISVISSAKRGFVRTAIEVVGFVLAIYIAFAISGAVATAVYDNVVEPGVISAVTENVNDTAGATVDSTINAVWEGLPGLVKNSAGYFGVEKDAVSSSIQNQISSSVNVEEIAETVAQKTVKPIVIPLIKSVLGMILFLILTFVVKILARVINRIFKLPLIGGLNKMLGGVIGLAKGLVFSAIICVAISTLIAITGSGFLFFTKENIDQSLLFGLLANIIKF